MAPDELYRIDPELKPRTLYRYMKTGGPASPNGEAYRLRIARACDVPDRFMLEGWAPLEVLDGQAELEQRIRELEDWRDEEGRQRPA